MKTFLMLGAVALIASTSGVFARGGTTVSLDGYCNAYNIKVKAGIATVLDTGCSEGFGVGTTATVKGFGKSVVVALQDPVSTGYQFMYEFSYPFASGGTFTLYSTTDGKTYTIVVTGTYESSSRVATTRKSGKSATSLGR